MKYLEEIRTQINFMWFSEDRRVKISSFNDNFDNRMYLTLELNTSHLYALLCRRGFGSSCEGVYNESFLLVGQLLGFTIFQW